MTLKILSPVVFVYVNMTKKSGNQNFYHVPTPFAFYACR
jgi:hypothetical protein